MLWHIIDMNILSGFLENRSGNRQGGSKSSSEKRVFEAPL